MNTMMDDPADLDLDGMADACNAYDIAVISGNVSFYNDTQGASIPPKFRMESRGSMNVRPT